MLIAMDAGERSIAKPIGPAVLNRNYMFYFKRQNDAS